MALEDGITLGTLLGSLNESSNTSPSISPQEQQNSILELIKLFESNRKPRTSLNQKGSQSNQYWYQASSPEDMERRNTVLRAATGWSSCEWKGADIDYQKALLGFDAKASALEVWEAWKQSPSAENMLGGATQLRSGLSSL